MASTPRRAADAPINETSGFFAEVRALYRNSLKPRDIAFNIYVARPLAAVLLYGWRRTGITPNQLSILGLVFFVAAPMAMVWIPDYRGFLLATAIVELAYLMDCCDGQLARLNGKTSTVGAFFDFLIDEVKALLLVGGASVALWRAESDERWLLVGVAGLILVSISTSLTTFIRRPEYAGRTVLPGTNPAGEPAPTGMISRGVWLVIRTLRLVVHYPTWLPILAIAGLHHAVQPFRIFLVLYLTAFTLYLGRTGLSVLLRLGSPGFYLREQDGEPQNEKSRVQKEP